ncbi:hypothetical protein Tco_0007714 [Tanacetum coccineum]
MPRDCLRIIESKSKVRNSRNKPVVAKVSSSSSTLGISPDVAELKDMVKALLLDKKSQAPTPVKAVEEKYVSQAAAANYNPGNTGYRAPIANQIRPPGFPPLHQAPPYQALAPQTQGVTKTNFESYVKANDAKYQRRPTSGCPSSTSSTHSEARCLPLVPNLKPTIPYLSRRNDERRREKANDQIEKFYEIFKDLSFEISLTDALILMPKFASTLKALIGNKEKLSEMARTR